MVKISNTATLADVRRGLRRRSKYGTIPVTDPETGRRVASKREMKLLARLRYEARIQWRTIALQPRFVLEGGTYTADALEVTFVVPCGPEGGVAVKAMESIGFRRAWVRVWDAKGFDTAAGRKSRRQVKERYGVEVKLE